MPGAIIAFLIWPSEKDYPRFREVCDDRMPEAYAEWRALVEEKLADRGIDPAACHKVPVDPDAMAAWCRANGGNVDANTRSRYAAMVGTLQHAKGTQSHH